MKKKSKQRSETLDAKHARARKILTKLHRRYPEAGTALSFQTPLQLLISVILSAQCTDVRVNMVTPGLFKRYTSARAFAQADPHELEEAIHSTGFFRNKAKNIIGCCAALLEQHGGEVPRTMDELVRLPGVGRKTANCVLGGAYGIASGVVVDTHVARLSTLLGLTKNTDPVKIESDLCGMIEKKDWIFVGNALILHGRQVCIARRPRCAECILNELCPSAEVTVKAKG